MKPEIHGIPAAPVAAVPADLWIGTDFTVIDVEVTGLDPEADEIIEIAAVRVIDGVEKTPFVSLVEPGIRIPCTASAVSHITDDMVEGAPRLADLAPGFRAYIGDSVLVAHHAELDRAFVNPGLLNVDGSPAPDYGVVAKRQPGREWICTYRLARHLLPDAPEYSNQVLRYWLQTHPSLAGLTPHRALADVRVTLSIFEQLAALYSPDGPVDLPALLVFAQSRIPIRIMPFGQHAGQPLSRLPAGYLKWALSHLSLDRDLGENLAEALANRS